MNDDLFFSELNHQVGAPCIPESFARRAELAAREAFVAARPRVPLPKRPQRRWIHALEFSYACGVLALSLAWVAEAVLSR